MSEARIRPTRRGSRTRRFDFTPGSLERLTLTVSSVPSAEGLLRAKLTGQALTVCDAGKVHRPEIEIEMANMPQNSDAATLIAAHQGDIHAATELALELEGYALEDWFDPCEAEGLSEAEDRDEKYDV